MLLRIELITSSKPRVWQLMLRDRLRALGHEAWLRGRPDVPPLRGLRSLAAFESLAYQHGPGGGESWLAETVPSPDVLPCDLSIDFVGDAPQALDEGVRQLVVLADGSTGEAALVAPLLEGHSPELVVALRRGDALVPLSSGVPALEEQHRIVRSFDRVCARLVDLIIMALRALEGGEPAPSRRLLGPMRLGSTDLAGAALRNVAWRLKLWLGRRGEAAPAWRIAWRPADEASLLQERLAWPQAGYEVVPDDGRRYYADPFLFAHEGRCWLFCEEFPFATGRGLISAVEMGPQGPLGQPQPVLEEPWHLSYPQVFAHEGNVYMVPETPGRSSIELWRAERLPDRWTRHATLIEGINAADPTLVWHAGHWWLFAAVANPGQSSWDTLAIFFSERLEGPWRAHPTNPVLIDARAARSAGRMFMRQGALWRPVQDCADGYGSALVFARVTQLTPERFAQEPGPVLRPPPSWHSRGVHTVNAAAGFEVIDVLTRPVTRLPVP